MNLSETILASGSSAGLLALFLFFLMKVYKNDTDRRLNEQSDKLDEHQKEMRTKFDAQRKDIAEIRVQTARISTAVDIHYQLSEKKKFDYGQSNRI